MAEPWKGPEEWADRIYDWMRAGSRHSATVDLRAAMEAVRERCAREAERYGIDIGMSRADLLAAAILDVDLDTGEVRT